MGLQSRLGQIIQVGDPKGLLESHYRITRELNYLILKTKFTFQSNVNIVVETDMVIFDERYRQQTCYMAFNIQRIPLWNSP